MLYVNGGALKTDSNGRHSFVIFDEYGDEVGFLDKTFRGWMATYYNGSVRIGSIEAVLKKVSNSVKQSIH